MGDLRKIVERMLVPHTAFENASSRVNQCFEYADKAAEPICIAVIGESRTGKSRVLEECYVRHPQVRDADGLTVPILRVKTPSKPTVKGLAELMLRAMNDPIFDKGTENTKTIRLQRLMANASVRMVMIDEFQHFYDKGSHKVMHHVADWLKILVDDSRVALVVAGLPTCNAVLEQNEQLAGRFLSPIQMPRLDWKNDDHRAEFFGILGAFSDTIREHFDMPELGSAEMAFRCYCGTGGLIGYLTKFLRQAVWNAIDTGSKTITQRDLARAHNESVWDRDGVLGVPSPFNKGFFAMPSEDLLAKVGRIGTIVDPEPQFKKRSPRTRKIENIGHILSAR